MAKILLFAVLLGVVLLSCSCNAARKQNRGTNPSPVKTIQTTNGDIFDCVDIYKQPAFDHPSLKHHQILMQPNVLFEEIPEEEGSKAKDDSVNVELESGGCPNGTVPIHRSRKNNLTTPSNVDVRFWAIRRSKWRTYYGASSKINVYGVHPVGPNQSSGAMIWVVNQDAPKDQMPVVQAGWGVDPRIYGDEKTRLTIAWSKDGTRTACFNLQCGGFVQTNSKIAPGATIWPLSTYKGTQYYIYLHIYKDDKDNWWFAVGDVKNTVGYWPGNLFVGGGRFGHATWADFGGFVRCRRGEVCPSMGSGVTALEKYACTMEEVQMVGPDHKWGGLGADKQREMESNMQCYDVGLYKSDVHAYKFSFGGPPCSNTTV